MSKWRKKPVVVEAEQFFSNKTPWPAGVVDRWRSGIGGPPQIHTLEGPLMVSDGDWIITGVKGERYPCKPDVFAATYEPAE